MCGIASIFRFDDTAIDHADLRRMCSAIAHRGPDEAGFALFNSGSVGLGHVRLSIVDLQGGQQPIYNEDHSIAVICNGEIYDYSPWRKKLLEDGHRLRTTSDSELLVHLYEQFGMDFVQHLNGEFAFVLWDEKQQRLIAGKDPCGIKPLYYHVTPGELLICSEVKGILALNRIDRKLSARYLVGPALGIYLDNASAFENVHSLRPGHALLAKPDGSCREQVYYAQRFEVNEDMSMIEAVTAVRERIDNAVRRRLAADVPVHAYLSGGMDSTIVAGLMTQNGARFTCFNVGFPDSPYDESVKARHIARHFGQDFETVPCTGEEIAANIVKAVYCTEMPLNNYNAIAKMILSGFVRSRGVKVCLTGEGADELFAGYPYFKLEMLWRMHDAGGESRDEAIKLLKQFLELEYRSQGLLWHDAKAWHKAANLFGYPSFFHMRARDATYCVKWLYQRKNMGLTPEDTPVRILRSSLTAERLQGVDPFNKSRLLTLNQLYNLVIPTLGDRVEMANSLECRPPFLDRDLLELAGTIPPRYFMNIKQLREKNLLREACKDLLPPMLRAEHKHPFLAPTWESFAKTTAGKPLFAEFLSKKKMLETGIFRPRLVSLLRFVTKWLPVSRGLARKVDALTGTILTTHLLHHLFVEQRIACDPQFPMTDRTVRGGREGHHAA